MASHKDGRRGSRRLGTFRLILIIVVLLLIPTTMEQLEMHRETVVLVGRVCVGIAALFFVYGLLSKALRLVGVVLLVLIGARALANEGVLDVPDLLERFQEGRSQQR